ncbi:cytochrome protein [Coniella lustricola]|uniref:Cytochrome protein n=1 Tax=Coniella lustricola TaxID=2025994 RepID=A0A2T3A618_9PEZI|nr:cytochrome protein [Coniella lustricola]
MDSSKSPDSTSTISFSSQLGSPLQQCIRAYWYLVLALIVVALKSLHNIHHERKHNKLRSSNGCLPPPSFPSSSDILGLCHARDLIKAKKQHHLPSLWDEIYSQAGDNVHTISHHVLGTQSYWTRDAANIRAVLAVNFSDWELPAARVAAFLACWGGGIFGADGADWQHSRALLRPSFNNRQISDTEMMEQHVQNLIARIPDKETVDLAELFPFLTMDIATDLLFGETAGCLDPDKTAQGMKFTSCFNYIMTKMSLRVALPVAAWIPDPKLEQCVKHITDFTDFYVARALQIGSEKPIKDASSEDERRGSKYVFLDELAQAESNPQRLRGELLSVMVAGRDTTASLLSIMWWHLARRPDIVGRIRRELTPLKGQCPTAKELKSLQYLGHFVNEVLRLYPINPINSRVARRDTMLPRGGGADGRSPIYIRRGERFIFTSSALHRRTDLYGEDAMQLRPERWEEAARPSTWEYIPFGGGPRICIGQQLAITEAAYTTVRLLQEFSHLEPRSDGPFQEAFAMALHSGDGCKLSLGR